MIDYLKKFDITDDNIKEIKNRYNEEFIFNFEAMMDNVEEVLAYLKEKGVTSLLNVVLYRPDICFRDIDLLKEQLDKYDSNLITTVFNKDIKDLISFDI